MHDKLNKATTTLFFKDEHGYDNLCKRWSKLIQDPKRQSAVTSEQRLLYMILRGRDYRQMFTPASSSKKNRQSPNPNQTAEAVFTTLSILVNTQFKFYSTNMGRAVRRERNRVLAPFKSLLSPDFQLRFNKSLPPTFTAEGAYTFREPSPSKLLVAH